jgi:hypothetical protein
MVWQRAGTCIRKRLSEASTPLLPAFYIAANEAIYGLLKKFFQL